MLIQKGQKNTKINNVHKEPPSRECQNSAVQRDNCKSREITVFKSYF